MRATELVETIKAMRTIRKSLFIWGAAGIGKSSIVAQTAHELGVDFADYRAVYRDAVDVLGLPGAREGVTYYNLPAGLPRNGAGILLVDELPDAPAQTQAAFYQLFNDRRVGEYVVPEGWSLVAAGNRQNDRGMFHKMPDPLVDRFFHVELTVNLSDLCQWALNHGVRPEVIAFWRFREQLVHVHDPKRTCIAFATPRGYADVSKILDLNLSPGVEAELIRGRIGDAQAGEFMAFLTLIRSMVSPDQILLNPTKADVPSNGAILYALAEALARRATPKNIDAVLTYAKRMPSEYAQCLVASMTQISPQLCNTPEFIRWATEQN